MPVLNLLEAVEGEPRGRRQRADAVRCVEAVLSPAAKLRLFSSAEMTLGWAAEPGKPRDSVQVRLRKMILTKNGCRSGVPYALFPSRRIASRRV